MRLERWIEKSFKSVSEKPHAFTTAACISLNHYTYHYYHHFHHHRRPKNGAISVCFFTHCTATRIAIVVVKPGGQTNITCWHDISKKKIYEKRGKGMRKNSWLGNDISTVLCQPLSNIQICTVFSVISCFLSSIHISVLFDVAPYHATSCRIYVILLHHHYLCLTWKNCDKGKTTSSLEEQFSRKKRALEMKNQIIYY